MENKPDKITPDLLQPKAEIRFANPWQQRQTGTLQDKMDRIKKYYNFVVLVSWQ